MRRMSRALRTRLRAGVLVTLKSGETFRGVLFDDDGVVLVLRNVEHVTSSDRGSVIVDGELLVFVRDVAFVQFVD